MLTGGEGKGGKGPLAQLLLFETLPIDVQNSLTALLLGDTNNKVLFVGSGVETF